jgi:hypothetical protein
MPATRGFKGDRPSIKTPFVGLTVELQLWEEVGAEGWMISKGLFTVRPA